MEILMPALSPTMEEGNLIKWYVTEGQVLNEGDLIAEIETDKAIMEFESPLKGKVKEILIPEGSSDIKINQPILILFNENEKKEITSSEAKEKRVKISPYAKKIARENNLNLKDIDGSGPNGRIILKNIKQHTKLSNVDTNLKQESEFEILTKSSIRQSIFERMELISKTIPHFYLRKKINIDNLINLRKKLNNKNEVSEKISINDFFIKATGMALQKYPDFNLRVEKNDIIKCKTSDIAIAVAIEDGLMTPIIRDVQKKNMLEIAKETKIIYEKTRNRKLLPSDYIGGSTAISNLGMKNIDSFDAIINPPNSSILAIGSANNVPIANENEIEIKKIINVTLSVDHRVLDGEIGSNYLNQITYFIENPYEIIF